MYKAIIHPKNHGYAIEIEADSASAEIKLVDGSAARVTRFTTREVDCLIATLQAARSVMKDP